MWLIENADASIRFNLNHRSDNDKLLLQNRHHKLIGCLRLLRSSILVVFNKNLPLSVLPNMVFCPDNGSGIVVMQNSDIGMRIRDEVTNAFKEIYGW